MIWVQKSIQLSQKSRGCHLVHNEILRQVSIAQIKTGICQVFIQHTSASLALNENADPSVRSDLELFLKKFCSDDTSYFSHTFEGADDMPAHIKNIMIGHQVSMPISDGKLALGPWQGLYLCEHRDNADGRKVIITAFGESF